MLVELELEKGGVEEINTAHVRSMQDRNVAEGDEQARFVTTITFVDGAKVKYLGSRREIKSAFKQGEPLR
jgi:hypothetical protein